MVEKTADSESKRTPASNGSVSSDGETGGSRRLSSYLQSVAQISGVVTIIAASIYALGVFTLVLPIANTYNSTFPAAWYAVSVVPRTVVAGHGISHLVWPSLALTLGTTLFALMLLWVLHTLLIGWHHARAAAERPALSLFSILNIYAFVCVLTVAIVIAVGLAVFGREAFFSGSYSGSGIGYFVVDDVLGLMVYLAAGLCVLSYSAAAVVVVARWLPGAGGLNRSRTFLRSSISLRGFIYKGLAFTALSSVFLLSAYFVSAIILYPSGDFPIGSLPDRLVSGSLVSLALVVLFGLAAASFLMLRLLRYTHEAHLISEARRSNFTPIFAPLRDLSASLVQRASRVSPTVPYSMVLFSVLYLAVFVAFNTLAHLVLPLVGEVRGEIKSATWLDECFVPLVVFGALVSGVIMYRKDWKDLGSYEGNLLARGSWRPFSIGLLKSIGAHSLRRGLLLSLVVAYVIALASAFLLAHLNPPPLPKVEVNELPQPASSQTGPEPDFQGKTLALLAHTEGYWYLIDRGKGHLLVVPDQDDKFIRLRLDEQP
jgi:hypothetical protein